MHETYSVAVEKEPFIDGEEDLTPKAQNVASATASPSDGSTSSASSASGSPVTPGIARPDALPEPMPSAVDTVVRMRNGVMGHKPVSYWTEDKESRSYVFKLFTCFYALFLVVSGIVIELSNLIDNGGEKSLASHAKDLALGIWLFGGSITFIMYCAFLVWRECRSVREKRRSLIGLNRRTEGEGEYLSNSYTGSLYLRLGCVVFGLIGVVYYGLIFVICLLGWSGEDTSPRKECTPVSDTVNIMAAIFIFVQMWFVYCNGKIMFVGKGNVARFGLMHLAGTNLWMWLRYIIYEEVETIAEIKRAQNISGGLDHSPHVHGSTTGHHEECIGVLCLFEGYNEFMYTCVVEYSLICAGVAFVFWTNIETVRKSKYEQRRKKRNMLTIDCSRTSEGLFAGFIFVVITIIAIALFNAYADKRDVAQWIFSGTNLVFYVLATIICICAFYRMSVLKFNHAEEEEDESAELLDQILLVVGLIGELVFCIGGMLSFVSNPEISSLSSMLLILNAIRLIQVTLQSGLIMVGNRLCLDEENPTMLRYKPGKQLTTLLLMINCAQFLMSVFEAQKAGVDEEMVKMYGSYYWAVLVRGCSPLTIFYRFHSSACFAEIWKKTYKVESKRKCNAERHRHKHTPLESHF